MTEISNDKATKKPYSDLANTRAVQSRKMPGFSLIFTLETNRPKTFKLKLRRIQLWTDKSLRKRFQLEASE